MILLAAPLRHQTRLFLSALITIILKQQRLRVVVIAAVLLDEILQLRDLLLEHLIRPLEVLDVLVLGLHGKNGHVDGRLLRVVDYCVLLCHGVRLYDGMRRPIKQLCSLRSLVERLLDNLLVCHRIERLGRKIKQHRRVGKGGAIVCHQISFAIQFINDTGDLFSS